MSTPDTSTGTTLLELLLQRHGQVHDAKVAERQAAERRRQAVLELRLSPDWDRVEVALALAIDPKVLDRLVREARRGEIEQR